MALNYSYQDPQRFIDKCLADHCEDDSFNERQTIQSKTSFEIINRIGSHDQYSEDYSSNDQSRNSSKSKLLNKSKAINSCPIKKKKPTFKTNNMLPPFKHAHKRILRQYMGEESFNQHPFLKYMLIVKEYMGIADFEKMYKDQSLKPFLQKMFKTNRLYRELYRGRPKYVGIRVFLAKIHLLQQAFKEGVFERIN